MLLSIRGGAWLQRQTTVEKLREVKQCFITRDEVKISELEAASTATPASSLCHDHQPLPTDA